MPIPNFLKQGPRPSEPIPTTLVAHASGGLGEAASAALPPRPTPVFMPKRAMSARAAAAEAEWEQLETTLALTTARAEASERRAALLEEANAMLHSDLDKIERSRDHFRRRCIIIETKLVDAATLIKSALEFDTTPPPTTTPLTTTPPEVKPDLEPMEPTEEKKP